MRRGLIVWNPEEITQQALDDRLARLRSSMAEAGLDAFILYTNFVRPAAVAYMSSFSPYWADALLFIPKSGQPTFSTSMSTRMNKWIKTVNPVGDIVNTRRPGIHIGEWLKANADIGKVGVLEMDGLPGGIYNDLIATAPAVEFVEATDVYASFRSQVDATELKLLIYCDQLAEKSLAAVDPHAMGDAGIVVGTVEQVARLGGAEEAYIAIAPDLDQDPRLARISGAVQVGSTFAVRASLAYKGAWVRRTKSYSSDPEVSKQIRALDDWFADLIGNVSLESGLSSQIEAAAIARGGTQISLLIESCTGTYPLQALQNPDDLAVAGQLYVISLAMQVGEHRWASAAPIIAGSGCLGSKVVGEA